MPESLAATMKLVGGDPALDFVNTVGGRAPAPSGPGSVVANDKLGDYRDLVLWTRHVGLLDEAGARELLRGAERRPREGAGMLARGRRLRGALFRGLRVLRAGRRPEPADLAAVNAEVGVARARAARARGRRPPLGARAHGRPRPRPRPPADRRGRRRPPDFG